MMNKKKEKQNKANEISAQKQSRMQFYLISHSLAMLMIKRSLFHQTTIFLFTMYRKSK